MRLNFVYGSSRMGFDRSQSLMVAQWVSGSLATEPVAQKVNFEEKLPSSEACPHSLWTRGWGQAWSGSEARVEGAGYGAGRQRAM